MRPDVFQGHIHKPSMQEEQHSVDVCRCPLTAYTEKCQADKHKRKNGLQQVTLVNLQSEHRQ